MPKCAIIKLFKNFHSDDASCIMHHASSWSLFKPSSRFKYSRKKHAWSVGLELILTIFWCAWRPTLRHFCLEHEWGTTNIQNRQGKSSILQQFGINNLKLCHLSTSFKFVFKSLPDPVNPTWAAQITPSGLINPLQLAMSTRCRMLFFFFQRYFSDSPLCPSGTISARHLANREPNSRSGSAIWPNFEPRFKAVQVRFGVRTCIFSHC